jgi:hypothetical protein
MSRCVAPETVARGVLADEQRAEGQRRQAFNTEEDREPRRATEAVFLLCHFGMPREKSIPKNSSVALRGSRFSSVLKACLLRAGMVA